MQIVLASRNAHKAVEIEAILAGTGVEVLTLDAFPDVGELAEDGDTFEANALQKAEQAHALTGCIVVADDSGLEVDALGGAPGVYSKRFSPEATGPANNALLIERLTGQSDRSARFRCVISVVGLGEPRFASGACEGQIGVEEVGAGGFGYDPVFFPEEANGRSMAELSMDEKNAISHRGRAFRQLPKLLGGS